MSLDPNDPTAPYLQMANRLRAAIRLQEWKPGDKLPSQHELSAQYGVARMTVQQALRVLRDEGLIVTRQGSGAFVKAPTERAVDLRPKLQEAFTQSEVTIDFMGFTAETLNGALTEPLDRIRTGELPPNSIAIRLLLPNTDCPLSLPVIAGKSSADSAPARERLRKISDRSVGMLTDALTELQDLKLTPVTKVDVRYIENAPQTKLVIINSTDVFCGDYPVKLREVTLSTGPTDIYDPMGKDATLFHYAKDADIDSLSSLMVEAKMTWFDNQWNTIARPR